MDDEQSQQSEAGFLKPNSSFPLVSRCFRALELRISTLWTYVHIRMAPDRMRLQNSRSGSLGLTFCAFHRVAELGCTFRNHNRCRCEKWTIIAQNSRRWNSSDVHVRRLEHSHTIHTCIIPLRDAQFPFLHSLRLLAEDPNSQSVSVFRSWSFPILQDLRCGSPDKFLAIPISNRPERVELIARQCPLDIDLLHDKFTTEATSRLTSLKFVFGTVQASDTMSGTRNDIVVRK